MAQETKKEFDERQLQAIGADGTAIVSAGAGSGKTTVLAARYLRLVKERGLPVDSILALTFTIKATSEMFGRIYASLSADGSDFVRAQVAEFSKSQISTLDSFCSRVARSGCAAWGFSPDFAVDDQLVRDLAQRQALAFVLEKRGEPIVRKLIGLHGFERVCGELFADAALRMCPARPWDFAAMPAELEAFLRAELRDTRDRLCEIRALALDSPAADVPKNFRDVLSCEPPEAESAEFDVYCAALAAVRKPPAGKPFRDEADAIKDRICKAVASIKRSLALLPGYGALYALWAEFQERVIASKRSANVLSFNDSSEMARQALIGDPGLRAFYKRRFKAIMIDEFQDNNQLQKDILYMLAERPDRMEKSVPRAAEVEGGKLFFVGDEKQSIYRFRGADVSVFRKLGGELGKDASEIFLSMNYRSEPRLIEFQNALFPAVMADARMDYEACYQPIGARPATDGIAPRVLRLVYAPPVADGIEEDEGEQAEEGQEDGADGFLHPHECEAWGIAQFIRDSVDGGRSPLMVRGEGGRARPARYGDFAILLRTTGRQGTLERFLRLSGVPYASADLCGFYSEAPANDLYAAMRCAIYPQDRAALAAYFRSPFANLSDETIAGLFLDPLFLGWRDLGAERIGRLPGAEGVKASRCRATLEAVAAMADLRPISRVASFLWYEAGYREFVLRRVQNHAYLEFFDFFFALADDADKAGRTLASFVGELESLMGGGERLKDADPPREEGDGVRVMTIHKSKGLEFPIVIVPGMEAPSSSKEGAPLAHWWRDRCLTVKMAEEDVGAEDFFFKSCQEERAAMARAELKRLFYVACTRAECHLVFSECLPAKRDALRTSLRTMLEEAMAASEAGSFIERGAHPDRTQEEYFRLVGAVSRSARAPEEVSDGLSRSGRLDRPAARREFAATELNAAYAAARGIHAEGCDEEGLEAAAGDSLGPAFGVLVHALIQRELEGTPPGMPLPAQAQAAIDSGGEGRDMLAEARGAARAFLDSGLRGQMDAADWKMTEYPFLLMKETGRGRYFIRGVIDLLFVKDGECVVVDYKTNARRVEGEYGLQMGIYREAAAALCGTEKVRCLLFYPRSGGAFESDENPDAGPILDSLTGENGR